MKCNELKRDFRSFLVMDLQKRYRKIFAELINIFIEKKIDIECLISVLRCDYEKSVFSTEVKVFDEVRTVTELFHCVAQYCKGIYDYEVLSILVKTYCEGIYDYEVLYEVFSVLVKNYCKGIYDYEVLSVLVKISQCSENKELIGSQQNSILKELDLMSELLHSPDDTMPGTCKFIVGYDGVKCTIETKEMVLGIIKQSMYLKHATLIFKNVEVASNIRFIFQVSRTIRSYLLRYNLSKQDVRFLEENKITSLIVDGVKIMGSLKLNKVCVTTLYEIIN